MALCLRRCTRKPFANELGGGTVPVRSPMMWKPTFKSSLAEQLSGVGSLVSTGIASILSTETWEVRTM